MQPTLKKMFLNTIVLIIQASLNIYFLLHAFTDVEQSTPNFRSSGTPDGPHLNRPKVLYIFENLKPIGDCFAVLYFGTKLMYFGICKAGNNTRSTTSRGTRKARPKKIRRNPSEMSRLPRTGPGV
ncbi:hypothetical protein OPQ81_000247 [Rhizoctonia solani]|nr:hypothetical protein OPQ81_000247 [Rhizoctonia solani]